jgi:hypothetical protein
MLIPSVLAADRMSQPPERLQWKRELVDFDKTHELSAVRYSLDSAPCCGDGLWPVPCNGDSLR